MPQRSLSFAPATPNIIAFASADTRLIVGLTQGPILVFDAARFFSAGSDEIPSLHSFSSTTSSPPRQILPNPDDMPDLIAVLRDGNGSPGVQLVEILDVQKLECIGGWRSGNAPDATPTSCKHLNNRYLILIFKIPQCHGHPRANRSQSAYRAAISLLSAPQKLARRSLCMANLLAPVITASLLPPGYLTLPSTPYMRRQGH